jgi:hypothetical protein
VMKKIRKAIKKRWRKRMKMGKRRNFKSKMTYRETRYLMMSKEKITKANKWTNNKAKVWSNGEMRNKSKKRIMRRKNSPKASPRPKKLKKERRLKSNNN